MNISASKENLDKLFGDITDISPLINNSNGNFGKVSFYLYKETAVFITVISHLFTAADPSTGALTRNQAIEAGLLIRIVKYMMAVSSLLCDSVRVHGDVILSLNRCIIESAINLKFFCEKASEKDFEVYIKSSLKPEKELYHLINEAIKIRGETLPIETRIIKSINKVFLNSGISDITDLDKIPKRKNYKQILAEINMDSSYSLLQGIPSHAIHGTWVDVLLHHLEVDTFGFKPKTKSLNPDTRMLCPPCLTVLMSAKSYINKYYSGFSIYNKLLGRLDDLMKRLERVDELHEKTLS